MFDMFSQMFSNGAKYFGSKPNIPSPPTAQDIGADFASSNLANLPQFQALASQTNAFSADQIQKMLEKFLPGVSGQVQKNILAMSKGEIPTDVGGQITRNSAARALAGGYGGSGLHGNLQARDLGLTSLSLQNQAADSASRWMATINQTPGVMDVSKMFTQSQLPMQWQRDVMQAKIAAAPDPVARGRADQEMALFSSIMSAVGGMAGAA